MADTPNAFMASLKKNVHLWFAYGLGLLLLIRLGLYLMMAGYAGEPVPDPQPASFPPIDTAGDTYTKVEKMLDPWPPFENSEYYPIATYNIFDPKTVQDAGALEQRANEKYNQAYIAYQQRNLAGALQYVNEALQIAPNHRAARQMLEKLNAEMQPAATDGASSPTAGGG